MRIGKKHYRTIWLCEEKNKKNDLKVCVIDQRLLPHTFKVLELSSTAQMCHAISDMAVRGAGLIGASAGFGMLLAACEWKKKHGFQKNSNLKSFDKALEKAAQELCATRPTAVNLSYAVLRVLQKSHEAKSLEEKFSFIREEAQKIADEDAAYCKAIGEHGLKLIEEIYAKTQKTVNILTHCNAGWLAFVDYGSALSPIYAAHKKKIPLHVWVDETRPRNQGASLTAFELQEEGIAHSVICDNTGGHLMQHNMVDLVIVGADRVSRKGDVANKIGTYLKALAAFDNKVPFYVALPSSTFDFEVLDGVEDIPIEERNEKEVKYIEGLFKKKKKKSKTCSVLLTPKKSPCVNYACDVTPNHFSKGLITEKGIIKANEKDIVATFKERIKK